MQQEGEKKGDKRRRGKRIRRNRYRKKKKNMYNKITGLDNAGKTTLLYVHSYSYSYIIHDSYINQVQTKAWHCKEFCAYSEGSGG